MPDYGRPMWDGLAYLAYGPEADRKTPLGQDRYTKRVVADEAVTTDAGLGEFWTAVNGGGGNRLWRQCVSALPPK